ncbi:MAG: GNAT family N-acetyltransferase [Candidatus Eisenbacteria bacterium]|nr:GNAT family N-acetyltransferase [Candidatus Eisenbacteria bacterium]
MGGQRVADAERSFFIKGEHVGLARRVPADDRLVHENWRDPEVQRAYNVRPPWDDLDSFRAFHASPERRPFRFDAAVVDLRDGSCRGVVTLAPPEREPDISISLFRGSRGGGLGAEALGLALEYSFRKLELDHVVAGAYEHNVVSIALLEKLGFRREPGADLTEDDAFGPGSVRQLGFRLDRVDWEERGRGARDRPEEGGVSDAGGSTDSGFANVYEDEQRASAYAELAFPGTYSLAFRDLPELFQRHVTGKRALDFGCGTGRSTRFLEEHGFEVVGVDISPAMLTRARELDPEGDYRLVDEEGEGLEGGAFDLVLSAFTFDNIPTLGERGRTLTGLGRILSGDGCLVCIVSSPEIYVNEWTSFSTSNHPENRKARSGDVVRIVMLDVPDRRPVEDVVCFDEDYRRLFRQAGLDVVEMRRPLATGAEPIEWKSECSVAPWTIYVLKADER